jgi:hypothetical protein
MLNALLNHPQVADDQRIKTTGINSQSTAGLRSFHDDSIIFRNEESVTHFELKKFNKAAIGDEIRAPAL